MTDSKRSTTEDADSDSQKHVVSCSSKEPSKHKKRRKSTESKEEAKKMKRKKVKKEHKKKKKHKSKHSSSPECFGPMPSTSFAEISEPTKSERIDDVGPCDKRVMVPMTKEQWEKERQKIRHVFDPETGRNRLVRGNGEILEEIVSKKRHEEINKQATSGDGLFYQFKAGLVKTTK